MKRFTVESSVMLKGRRHYVVYAEDETTAVDLCKAGTFNDCEDHELETYDETGFTVTDSEEIG